MPLLLLAFIVGLCLIGGASPPATAQPLSEWKSKARFAIDTTAEGADLKSALQQFVLPVRLHTGNFDFKAAKPDGGDLRFVAADGKTVLPHRLESFDAGNELAVAWVQVPSVAPSTREQYFWIYHGNPAATAPADARLHDARTPVALRFSGPLRNEGGAEVDLGAQGLEPVPMGVAGQAARLAAASRLTLSGGALKLYADGTTVSFWVRGLGTQADGAVLRLAGERVTVELAVSRGVPALRVTGAGARAPTQTATGTAPLAGDRWHLLSLVVGDRVALYADGREVAAIAVKVPEQPMQATFGAGAAFEIDELTVAAVARSPEFLKAVFASQGPDNSMVVPAEETASDEATYLRILVDNLTLDGKIVIYLLGVMFVIALAVIVAKSVSLVRIGRANAAFLGAFESAGGEVFLSGGFGAGSVGASALRSRFDASPLYRMFETASRELRRRVGDGDQPRPALGDKAINAIRASVDATSVRENARLNRFVVLLTIAISGGPFIGLLGTVVGVMITFAAIAAVGDVNINSIAPGIAAALLATVAGLAVAIPSLFAYNWLASRIKELTNEMQIFGDEMIGRIAEAFQA